MSVGGVAVTNKIQTEYELRSSQFVAGVKNINTGLDQLVKGNLSVANAATSLKNSLLVAGTAGAVVVATFVAVGAAAVAIVDKFSQVGEQLNQLSQQTGETVETISKLRFAAEQENVSLGQVTQGFRFLSRAALQATQGNKEASAAFRRLGVDVKNAQGGLKTNTELLSEVGKALQAIPAGAERSALAVQLLGRGGQQLIPLAAQFEELSKRAERLGLTISTKFAAQSATYRGFMTDIRFITERVGISIADALLPTMNELARTFVDVLAPSAKFVIEQFDDLGFHLFRVNKTFGFLTAAAVAFSAKLRGDEATLAGARQLMAEYAKEVATTREEYEKLRGAPPPTENAKAIIEDTLTALQRLNKEFEKATNADVTATVNLINALAQLGTEGEVAYNRLISKVEELAAKGNKEAALVLARIEAEKNARLAAIAEVSRAAAAAAGEAQVQGRPFGVPGGQIGPARAPLPGEAGFIGPQTREQVERATGNLIPETIDESASLLEKARQAQEQIADEAERANTAYEEGQDLIAGLSNLTSGFAEAIVSAAEGGKLAFQDFFKGLLRDLGRAILRATILTALLSFLGIGGGFSLTRLTKNIQALLGVGDFGFQDKESSLLGRAAQSRSAIGIGGPQLASAGGLPVPQVTVTPTVQINQATPMTWARVVDSDIMPRIRTRQRRLNDDLK